MKTNHSFLPLLITNLFGVANDNFLKTLASFVILGWVGDERTRTVLMGITAAMLVMPYVLLSPLADRLTVIFPKRRIITLAKFAEFPIVGLTILGIHLHSITLTICSIVIMGLQSSLYSPAKYALVRDIGGEDRISVGMGLMEGIAFLAVLGGTVAASFLADHARPFVWYSTFVALAAAGLVFSFTIRANETLSREIHSINPIRFLARAKRMTRRYRGLDAAISALCVFWAVAAMLQQGLIVYGTQVLGLDSTHTGVLLVLAAIGIVIGQILAGYFGQRKSPDSDDCHSLLAFVPATGMIAAILLAVLFAVPLPPIAFGAVLTLLAFDIGFFKLPLDAEIQRLVKGPRLNTVLAYFNQVTFLSMFIASVAYAAIGWLFGPRAFLAILAIAMAVASVAFGFNCRQALLRIGWWVLSRRYAVRADPIPHGHTLLVLPNHPALIDPLIVFATYRRHDLRPLVDASFFVGPFVNALAEFKAIPVPDLRGHHTAGDIAAVRSLDRLVLESLAAGGSVVLYPSGHIYTENHEQIGNRQLAYNLCRTLPSGVRVITLRTTGLWGSIFSRKGRKANPPFALMILVGLALWLFVNPFRPRRKITIHAEDQTDTLREWAKLTRAEFNAKLNDWYNAVT